MRTRLRHVLGLAGWPARQFLLVCVRVYRLTLGKVYGGGCRFYPSCSAYAETAIHDLGAVRGAALTMWRILRCSPLSAGGVDFPPGREGRASQYEPVIHGDWSSGRPRRAPA